MSTVVFQTHTGSVLSGTVGDRRLVLKEADEYGRPTLEVIDVQSTAGPFIDKIVYRRAAKWRNY